MPKTSTKISFGLYALEIKADSLPSTSETLQAFSKVLDLQSGNYSYLPFATFEPDFWLLDGNYKLLPTDVSRVHVGLMSVAQSGAGGAFVSPPVLTITFQNVHSVDALTFHFSDYTGDWADDIDVAYYDAADSLIRTDGYAPDAAEWSTGQAVADFKKIVITFNGTNKPTRYLRLAGLDYGELFWFTDEDIKTADVVEELDPASLEIRAGAFETEIYTEDGMFSIINPIGQYAALTEHQPLRVYETVDNQQIFIGQFYLKDWENKGEREIRFTCIDILGVLGGMEYLGGLFSAETMADLVEDILGGLSIPYELDSSLGSVAFTGWIPVCSYRDALQLICFAAGASISAARSGAIRIREMPIASGTPLTTIGRMEQGLGGSISLKPLVTEVEVYSHKFIYMAISVELFNDTLAAGDHTLIFQEPYTSYAISGATITSSGSNYVILNTAGGTVVLSGVPFKHTIQAWSITDTFTGAANVVRITDDTMVSAADAEATAQRLYDYFQQRYLLKLRLYAPLVEIGDLVLVDTLYNKQILGVVERMDTDLSGGMISKVEVVGVEAV